MRIGGQLAGPGINGCALWERISNGILKQVTSDSPDADVFASHNYSRMGKQVCDIRGVVTNEICTEDKAQIASRSPGLLSLV
jgi:hypothetical protein